MRKRNFRQFNENDDYEQFSTKGHAGIRVRPNDPRFADNPLVSEPEMLDEFDASSLGGTETIDRLHDAFRKGGISDQEIKQGIQLTPEGMNKVAAAFGVSPDDINLYLAALQQSLNDQAAKDMTECYTKFMEDDGEGDGADPFATAAADHDRVSAAADSLGDVTVTSFKTGDSKYYRGSQGAAITKKLQAAGNNDAAKQAILQPLVEDGDEDVENDFGSNPQPRVAGSFNFPWKLGRQHGFGTATFGFKDGQPHLDLIRVLDAEGDDVDLDPRGRQTVLTQARQIIPHL